MTGAACGAGNAYPDRAPDFTSGFHRGSCCPVICVSLFHVIVLSFGFWILNFVCSLCLIAWYLYFLLFQSWFSYRGKLNNFQIEKDPNHPPSVRK